MDCPVSEYVTFEIPQDKDMQLIEYENDIGKHSEYNQFDAASKLSKGQ